MDGILWYDKGKIVKMRSYYNGGVYRLSFKRKNNFMHLAPWRVLGIDKCGSLRSPQPSTRRNKIIRLNGKRERSGVSRWNSCEIFRFFALSYFSKYVFVLLYCWLDYCFRGFESLFLGHNFPIFIRIHSKVIKITQNANFLSEILHFKQEKNPKSNSGVRFRICLAEKQGFEPWLRY